MPRRASFSGATTRRSNGGKGFNACCDVVNRGVALWGGNVYVGALDGRLIALNAKTGKVAWSVQTTDPNLPYTITQAPRAVKGKILVGNGGAEYPVRGYLSAYDAASGKLVWRFHMTPNPTGAADNAASDKVMKEKVNATWFDGAWKQGGGGATPWDPITYDVKSDLIFVGTGNAGPWNGKIRTGGKGDNLFAASIVALKPDTGEYVWHYQPTPRDDWDFDATQHLMVADLTVDGAPHRVVMQANKNGFFYVIDAPTGKLLAADAFVKVTWATKVDLATGRPGRGARRALRERAPSRSRPRALWAATTGSPWPTARRRTWSSSRLRPSTWTTRTRRSSSSSPAPGTWASGPRRCRPRACSPRRSASSSPGTPVAKKPRWKVDFPEPWRSGVLATGGGLVFHAAGHKFIAFDAATGKELWSYDTGAGAIAAASTYSIDNEQYVALMVGFGGAGGMGGVEPRRKGRLLVFKLDGKTVPTPFPAPVIQPPLDLTPAVASTGDPAKGETLSHQFCVTCHNAGGYLPILARSPVILEPNGFKAIVIDGAKQPHGMAAFRRFFDANGAEDIRAYLLKEAAKPAPAAPTPQLTHGT
jgi:quinohemoprotein ethanol dehydrogenase